MKGAVLRLGLLMLLLAGIAQAQVWRVDTGTSVTLAAGALLLCGLFAGRVAIGLGLPRLTGYLLVGVAVGPYALGFIPKVGVAGLDLVKGLALGLIALVAGTELRLGLIRRVGTKVAVLCGLVCGVAFVATMAAIFALRGLLPFLAPLTWPQALAVAALIASVVVSFSPTVTIAVVQETRARGSFTEFLMALVIIGDLFVMVAFAVAVGVTRASLGGGLDVAGLLGGVGWELFGSVLVGAVLTGVVLVYMRRVRRELPLFLVALCFTTAEASGRLHVSPLLVMLAAGALIANLDEREGERIHHAIQQAGLPVFALFFAVAGAGLQLDALATVGLPALALVALRTLAVYWACRRFAPPEDPRLSQNLWLGLISQAGVSFGLAALITRTFPAFGAEVEVLIVAMITVNQLVGPVLTRHALARSGEIHSDETPETA